MDSFVADSLPLDVWKLIWTHLDICEKGRVEACSRALRDNVWRAAPISENNYDLEDRELALKVLALKPQAAFALRRLVIPYAMAPTNPYEKAFSHAKGLVRVQVVEPDKGGTWNALVAAGCPLKNISIVSHNKAFFSSLDLQGLQVFKPTLRRLALLFEARNTPLPPVAPPAFLETIASVLGDSLETLAISTDDWAPLKPMTKLRELFVCDKSFRASEVFNLDDMHTSVAKLSERTPASVGVNLVVLVNDAPTSLLMRAIESGTSTVKELLDNYAPDPNLAPFSYYSTNYRHPVLISAIERDRYDIAKLLIDRGARLFAKKYRHQSAFCTMLLKWSYIDREWTRFASYLFDELWPKVVGDRKGEDLLSFPPENVLFELLTSSPSAAFVTRSNFVLERPKIFGERSIHERNADGCNLCHKCEVIPDAEVLNDLGVDWRVKDNEGHDALECIALRSTLTRGLLQKWCAADEDFVSHCTPIVWGMVGSDLRHKRETDDSVFQGLIGRLIRLAPRESWQEIITAMLHVQIRSSSTNILGALLAIQNPELTPVVLRALFTPWRELKLRPWFPKFRLDPEDCHPLPHLLVHKYLLRLVGKFIRTHFATEEEAKAWIDEPNDRGQTARKFFVSTLNGKDLQSRLENFELLWPAQVPETQAAR